MFDLMVLNSHFFNWLMFVVVFLLFSDHFFSVKTFFSNYHAMVKRKLGSHVKLYAQKQHLFSRVTHRGL